MSPDCRRFRGHLESALSGRADTDALRSLSWHAHLLSCEACRDLLESEEALESVLASLPEPHLPAGMSERVLACLARDRERDREQESARLDALLEKDQPSAGPPGLARRILGGLEAERQDAALERLLERVPAPSAPSGLAERVLASLEAERRAPVRPVSRFGGLVRVAAGLALLAAGALGVRELVNGPAPDPGGEVLVDVDPPPPGLLDSLDLLESWDLITDDSLDATLSSLDAVDAVLFEIQGGRDPLSNG